MNTRHTRWLAAELDDLVASGVLEQDAAVRVRTHYDEAAASRPGIPLFAVLGAALTSLGVILLLAHNWDMLARLTKVGIGFGVLLAGQGAAAYAGWRHRESIAWTEATALAASFSVAACIAIVSQTYQLPSDFGSFLQTWCWLSLPIAYALDARVTMSLCLGLTAGAAVATVHDEGFPRVWLLLGATLPYLVWLARRGANGIRDTLLAWVAAPVVFLLSFLYLDGPDIYVLVPLSIATGIHALGVTRDGRSLVPYAGTPARVLGGLGIVGLFIALCFADHIGILYGPPGRGWIDPLPALTLALAGAVFAGVRLPGVVRARDHASALFLVAPAVFGLLLVVQDATEVIEIATWSASAYLAAIGAALVVAGTRSRSAFDANCGMLLIGIVVSIRFTSSDLSFLQRGLLFIGLGIAMIAVNVYLHRRRMGETS